MVIKRNTNTVSHKHDKSLLQTTASQTHSFDFTKSSGLKRYSRGESIEYKAGWFYLALCWQHCHLELQVGRTQASYASHRHAMLSSKAPTKTMHQAPPCSQRRHLVTSEDQAQSFTGFGRFDIFLTVFPTTDLQQNIYVGRERTMLSHNFNVIQNGPTLWGSAPQLNASAVRSPVLLRDRGA